jgi:hypothetical protein
MLKLTDSDFVERQNSAHYEEADLQANQRSDVAHKSKVKRYNLVIPSGLFEEVQTLADEESISVLEMLKRFIKIGLIITKLYQSRDAALIIRQGDRERELVLL